MKPPDIGLQSANPDLEGPSVTTPRGHCECGEVISIVDATHIEHSTTDGRGNSGCSMDDYGDMNCDTAREALSARIDGEQEPVPAAAVDQHLATCSSCRAWHARAEGLRRTMLLAPAPAIPDLTDAILAELPAPRTAYSLLRVALGVVAVVQTALALTQLFGVDTGMGHEAMPFMMGHMSHESAAWNLAVGIGLLWATLHTRTAAAQLPMLTVFVGALATASVFDVIRGDVDATRLLTHVPVVVGVALLYLVRRTDDDNDEPKRRATAPGRHDTHADFVDEAAGTLLRREFGQQRPTGRHNVA